MAFCWTLFPVCPCGFCPAEPRTKPTTPCVSHQGWEKKKDHLPQPHSHAFTNAAQYTVNLLCCRVHCWLMFSLLSTRTTRFFSTKLLSNWSVSTLYQNRDYSSWGMGPDYYPSINFLSVHFSNGSRPFWRTAQPSCASDAPPSLYHLQGCGGVHSSPSKTLMKTFHTTGPSVNGRGTLVGHYAADHNGESDSFSPPYCLSCTLSTGVVIVS